MKYFTRSNLPGHIPSICLILNMLRFACFFIFLFTFSSLLAQQLPLETFTPANGLVDSRIIKVYQDASGRMYFLTQEGFSIYDGQHFESYSTVAGVNAELSNDLIEENGVVTIYNFNGMKFVIKKGKPTVDSSDQKKLVETSRILQAGKNDWLIATNNHLLRYKNGKLNEVSVKTSDGKRTSVEDGVVYKNYFVFFKWAIKEANQLILYDYEKQQVLDLLKDQLAYALAKDKNGKVYFHNNSKWQQLSMAELEKGILKPEPCWFEKDIPADYSHSSLSFDNYNNAWLMKTGKGVCMIDAVTHQQTFYLSSQGLLEGVNDVFQDAENNYWFIAQGRGVQKLQQSPLKAFTQSGNTALNGVGVISPTEDGNCFLNTTAGYFINNKKLPGTLKDRYFAYWQNQCWGLKNSSTLVSSGGVNIALDKYLPGSGPDDFFSADNINYDREGRLLVPGVTVIAVDKQYHVTLYRLPYFCDNIVVDKENNYWCFLRSQQVVKLSWKNGKLEKTFSQQLKATNPRFTILWDDQTFIVGCRNEGIMIYKKTPAGLQFSSSFNKLNGLSSNFVYALLKKNDHELLAGTSNGLTQIKFNDKDTIIDHLSAKNNLFGNFVSLVQDKDSSVWCRLFNGELYKLTAAKKDQSSFDPAAGFRMIAVNNRPVADTQNGRFSYFENNLLFSVFSTSFTDSKNIGFDFQLSNGSVVWKQSGNKPEFEISNLSAGDYKLLVTISFSGKMYPDKLLHYSFSISKPYWRTWWFISLVVLIAASALVIIIRSFYRRQLEKQRNVLEKQQAIEKERTRIATDMHDDFGASLSRIKFISEKMRVSSTLNDTLKGDLNKISAYSDEMAEKMNEIVWALNQRYDSLDDLVSFSRAWASEYLQDKNIQLHFTAGDYPNKFIQGEVRRNIFLIIKEALHNVVKHAGATSARIDFEYNDQLYVRISDNGKGINTDAIRPFANGLQNMKKRMESIGGKFAVENNSGAAINISVPI